MKELENPADCTSLTRNMMNDSPYSCSLSPRICGLGMVSCLGWSVNDHIEHLRAGTCGLIPAHELFGSLPPWANVLLGKLSQRERLSGGKYAPASQLALQLAQQAVQQAGWGQKELSNTLLLVGSSRGNIPEWVGPWKGGRKLLGASNCSHAELAACVSIELDIHGPYQVLSNGCSAGLDALGLAAVLMRAQQYKRALVIGLDLPLSKRMIDTYWGAGMLSKNGINDPYGLLADGMCLAEGGAALALELDNSPGIYVQDYRSVSEAYSPLGLNPNAETLTNMLQQIVHTWRHRRISLCPHASGTRINAKVEQLAIQQSFSHSAEPAMCVLKPWVGHTLGASGLLELALWVAFAEQDLLPPNPPWITLPIPQNKTDRSRPDVLIKTAAGLGGHHAAVSISVEQ